MAITDVTSILITGLCFTLKNFDFRGATKPVASSLSTTVMHPDIVVWRIQGPEARQVSLPWALGPWAVEQMEGWVGVQGGGWGVSGGGD